MGGHELDGHDYRECTDEDCPAELCRIYKEGRRDGYSAGYVQGEAEGYAAGYNEGEAGRSR
jgi:flagellar biosynthesis/type III secretory pathway protein FliH